MSVLSMSKEDEEHAVNKDPQETTMKDIYSDGHGFRDTWKRAVPRDVNEVPRQLRLTEKLSSAERKEYPIVEGLLDYFPDACAYVAHVSYLGNAKHNPGEKMHHARGKSTDHADCVGRHLSERGGYDTVEIGGQVRRIRHSGALAWRALALLQEELERELGLPLPRGARE